MKYNFIDYHSDRSVICVYKLDTSVLDKRLLESSETNLYVQRSSRTFFQF